MIVEHEFLLGISGTLLEWLELYLPKRTIRVLLNFIKSSEYEIEYVIP